MEQRWVVSSHDGFLAWYEATLADAHRYAHRLVGSDRATVEDLVQDAYLSVLRAARSGSVSVATPGLIMSTVRLRFLDRLRAEASDHRRLRLAAPVEPDLTSTHDRPVGGMASDTVHMLPSHERAALVLRYVDALSVPEVADALGLTVRATESLLARAKSRARKERRDG